MEIRGSWVAGRKPPPVPPRTVAGVPKSRVFRTPISIPSKIYPFSPEKSKKEGFFVPPFSPIPTPKVVSGDGLSRPVLVKSTEAKVSAFCRFGARWPGRPWDEAWASRPRRSGVEAGTRV
ncbi:hypothetical protein ES332_D10G224500v1 [Gossypium tomentosum]|uniref:Uncharacterized protein n=1 Tax=Gossypium tomentosum TaxID=34277 RepID=A0A5D2J7Y8_GOSTO|nr:hypothetical protein ES332_D10G224500v1 [Gossypium tomentosum]